jgi:hypothetical protein
MDIVTATYVTKIRNMLKILRQMTKFLRFSISFRIKSDTQGIVH